MSFPRQPAQEEWEFVKELQTPLHKDINWTHKHPQQGEVDISNGVSLEFNFPDIKGRLKTAYADFKNFLDAGRLVQLKNGYKIITRKEATECFETFKLNVTKNFCEITAGDTEGIRRGLVFLEDEILRSGGPFVKTGTTVRKPLIKTRISRCFFGPIKRPPLNRDELADNVDYYPGEYLNRLAHEGINALWLTVSFKDLCPSELFPDHGNDSVERLRKLNKTVDKCAEYGIKIYIFCTEPAGFGPNPDHNNPLSDLEKNPELAGHKADDIFHFCTSTSKGRKYIEDCANFIFSKVPGLGGLIDINLGERITHCYSSLPSFKDNNCPNCSKRAPWEVVADTTSAIARGMQRANPDAEMISWLYVPVISENYGSEIWKMQEIIQEIAAHTPENVTLLYNFESQGTTRQLGKERLALDYWLSYIGPSSIFVECANRLKSSGSNMGAKIQVGCSHEVATVPFLPVPGNLFEKYKAMHELGVSVVMQCWYFGNYPGLMNKAAGELSFTPFPSDENEFLLSLAEKDWGKNAEKVVQAWKYFQDGYSNFPVNLSFTWYGPVHHSIVWPLYLFPVDQPISPSWKFTFPLESGDRIGECICYDHTLGEILELTAEMSEIWHKGVEIFESIESEYGDNRERLLDIGLAKALDIQFKSAYNVLKFYNLREKLPYACQDLQLQYLDDIKNIVSDEIHNCYELEKLCRNDSRLGFHSEAEGYKYFPEKLIWRSEKLKKMLEDDFPLLLNNILKKKDIFPDYTGRKPEGEIYRCVKSPQRAAWELLSDSRSKWRAYFDSEDIFIEIKNPAKDDDNIEILIEPCRLWPVKKFSITSDGKKENLNYKPVFDKNWHAETFVDNEIRTTIFKISFSCFEGYHKKDKPMRINIINNETTWIKCHPLPFRLRFGADNSADLGWFIFEQG